MYVFTKLFIENKLLKVGNLFNITYCIHVFTGLRLLVENDCRTKDTEVSALHNLQHKGHCIWS